MNPAQPATSRNPFVVTRPHIVVRPAGQTVSSSNATGLLYGAIAITAVVGVIMFVGASIVTYKVTWSFPDGQTMSREFDTPQEAQDYISRFLIRNKEISPGSIVVTDKYGNILSRR